MDDTIGEDYTTYGSITDETIHTRRRNDTAIDSIENESLMGQSQTTASTQPDDSSPSTIPLMTKIGFGLGHIYNDLCAGVWFSYTLLFLQGVLQMPGTEAGALMMIGQVGDAIATPIVGRLTDKYGTKQKWHIFGKS